MYNSNHCQWCILVNTSHIATMPRLYMRVVIMSYNEVVVTVCNWFLYMYLCTYVRSYVYRHMHTAENFGELAIKFTVRTYVL